MYNSFFFGIWDKKNAPWTLISEVDVSFQMDLVARSSPFQLLHLHLRRNEKVHLTYAPWRLDGARNLLLTLENQLVLVNPLTTIGSYTTHENSPGNSPDFVTPASRFGWPARSRHAVACMHRFSHILRASCVPASGLCPSGERSIERRRGNMRIYRSFPAVLK